MDNLIYKGRRIKKIGFFGLGKSSLGMLEYFKEKYDGISFVLRTDKRIPLSELRRALDFNEIYAGDCALENLGEDMLFLSPSVRRERFYDMSNGIILSSDAEFFVENTSSDIYAVTGSDGKSTVTTLTSMLLENCYEKAYAIGNIGVPMTPLTDIPKNAAAVCELSSFQLMYFAPKTKRALITNISENHLDWHTSFREYISAKENILKNAQERIINADCEISMNIAKNYPIFALYSASKNYKNLQKTAKSENYIYLNCGCIELNGEKILDTDEIRCKSLHNIENFMAATAMCLGFPIKEHVTRVANEFRGLLHRCEEFAKVGGVRYINSSIDSTPKRTATTLTSLQGKLIVILGGRGKGLDYSPLLDPLKKKAKAVILTGDNGKEIEELIRLDPDFERLGILVAYESDFDAATKRAVQLAASGDTVILSPASTSYDRFSNFEERGIHFKSTVNKLLK